MQSNEIPIGYNYEEILEKGKRIYKTTGFFIMLPYITADKNVIWSAETKTILPFEQKEEMVKYKYIRDLDEWIEIKEMRGEKKLEQRIIKG